MDRLFAERLFGVPAVLLALVALIIAVVFAVYSPVNGATGWRFVVLRWFHLLCWLLPASAATIRARVTPFPAELAGPLALAGGAVYAVYIVTLMAQGRPS